jgi:hypothetical protein
VNQCDLPVNIFSTEIACLLVIVQPLMWNIVFYMRSESEMHALLSVSFKHCTIKYNIFKVCYKFRDKVIKC